MLHSAGIFENSDNNVDVHRRIVAAQRYDSGGVSRVFIHQDLLLCWLVGVHLAHVDMGHVDGLYRNWNVSIKIRIDAIFTIL